VTSGLDERLLAALRRDGRADLPTIAAAVEADVPQVRERLRALEADGIIAAHTVRLDHDDLGHVTAVLWPRVDDSAVDALTQRLRDRPWVTSVYETTGPVPVTVVGRFVDETAYATAVADLHRDPDGDGLTVERVERVGCEQAGPVLED
jgi:DNA-binding Lrp family transcriptional regulator